MKTEDGQDNPALPDLAVDPALLSYAYTLSYVYTDTVPVIYGHYWFEWDNHRDDWTDYTACVDYSVAKEAGKLVAYRLGRRAHDQLAKLRGAHARRGGRNTLRLSTFLELTGI